VPKEIAMTFARNLSLASWVFLLVACSSSCSSSASPAPSNANVPVPDAGATPEPDASTKDAAVPDSADAGPLRSPGPSFTVPPEALAIENPGAPGGQSTSYTAAVDPATLDGGQPSMLLASTDGATATTFAATTATHAIDEAVRGRRYRMRARIKTENATAGWLWWRIDGPGFYEIDNMGNPVDRRVKGTKDWQQVSLVMDVAETATGFAFGSGLTGQGKVWVSSITFDQVGTDVPTTPHFGNEL
jgi:hypothetical protein